ncbi:hypothetical protein F2Q68_00036124 [Brassica cretica]|uniref:Uncharacterized protein n=1 Tax=Brassica cretica TaxID=69181 RepID=A0A8S9HAP0_BRACR|nr:hypothetical protein F2Q68_00036124 [Brassica cretica]
MESPVPSPSSSAPIDPGGASPARLSNRENRLLNRDLEMKLQSPALPASIPAAKCNELYKQRQYRHQSPVTCSKLSSV